MRLAIMGGALQGMETVYLSKIAGIETVVIDKRISAPALAIADETHIIDPVKDIDTAMRIFGDCDAVIPACEELTLLEILNQHLSKADIPFLFDLNAYKISCSKEKSNILMSEAGVPLPLPWPECGFPAIVKPSCQSGSIGVTAVKNEQERQEALTKVKKLNDIPVVQEFVTGKNVSIEAIGNGEKARSYATTEIILDRNYDCKMVRCAPDILSSKNDETLRDICKKAAEAIELNALMDMEAIDSANGLRVLEIDARIPSQTPAAVEAGTGINLLEELIECKLGNQTTKTGYRKAGIYEHYVFKDGILNTCGETEFGHVRNPAIISGLFGSYKMITDYEPGKTEWRAAVITKGRDTKDAEKQRLAVLDRIIKEAEVKMFSDFGPEMI